LQQSTLYAQACPVITQAVIAWQRGTPFGSSWHAPELPGAPQQSLRADETPHV
jgi:hypothetical protein